jgi:hypothetical protein
MPELTQKGGDEVGTGHCQREREPRERSEAVQTLLRARRRYVRIAQEGTLRETEREAQEEIGSRQKKGSKILREPETSSALSQTSRQILIIR